MMEVLVKMEDVFRFDLLIRIDAIKALGTVSISTISS